ncbi:MAG TPA: lysophospholipid acyltransferase family protein [Flavobacterium sp.]|nr:lysophospholipid acyltransferase family protein [Flavobacterium sp.]
MQKIISYPISVVYYLCFGLILCLFHPIQWICLNVFGYQAHKKSVDILNLFLIRNTHLLGTSYRIKNRNRVPDNVPLIIVSNHQSLYDIPPFIWFLRKSHVKFISKKELGKGIPSVSFNLRHGGSVLIDRKDPKQALPTIKSMAEYIAKHNRAVVIFPEGTRSRNGVPKKFSENGLKTLFKYAPSAYVLPVTINNSWKMVWYGMFPMGLGNRLEFTIHNPLKVSDYNADELIERTEQTIIKDIVV